MKSVQRTPRQFTIPRYEENAALQLVGLTGITFIMFHFARVMLLVFGRDKVEVFDMMYPNIGLSTIEIFKQKFWTTFTYGLAHHGFWDWLTNMIWAYCFASVLQNLTGYKQVIPLFLYGLFFGGIFYLVGQKVAGNFFALHKDQYILGAYGGIMALAVASITISPKYKLHLSENFSIPISVIVAIYLVLTTATYYVTAKGVLMLCIGGAFTGALFSFLLKKGFQPAAWVYELIDNIQQKFTPKEEILREKKAALQRKELLQNLYAPTKGVTQERIDELLDKINDHGYYSLTKEEKEALRKAGK